MIGIYSIENKINHKVYIGQSHNIKVRWRHHRSDLNNNRHHNIRLQNAWNKYGQKAFQFKIIEQTDAENLDNRQKYWITKYDSVNNGYNNDYGGGGIIGYKHPKQEIDKMRRIQNPQIVLQFDLNFNLRNEWIGGVSHIGKQLGFTRQCILIRCLHTIKIMSPYKNRYWVYKNEYISQDFSWEKYINNVQVYFPNHKSEINTKNIKQYTTDRKLLKIWDNIHDINKAGYNTTYINQILNKNGKRIYRGYIWCYSDYDFSDGYFDNINKYLNKCLNKIRKKVAKIDANTLQIIKIYSSLTQAGKDNNVNASCICCAARSSMKKKSCGYYWKYINEQ